jgi:hypothetical protein
MHVNFIKALGLVGRTAIAAGLVLMAINAVGFFCFTKITNRTPGLLDSHPRVMTEQDFWDRAVKKGAETDSGYIRRLTGLVSGYMLFIGASHTRPTLFENWIIWAYSGARGYHEWIDTKKAVRLGGGLCSQHAIVFNNIARSQNIESRLISTGGHVLNEVFVAGAWRVCDPLYNIVADASLCELEAQPEKAYQVYAETIGDKSTAREIASFFSSAKDNANCRTSYMYAPESFYMEKASFYLIWIIPALMILAGLLLKWICANQARYIS